MDHRTQAVKIGQSWIGDGRFAVIAGPCAIESLEHFLEVSRFVKSRGAAFLRGGLFKLRTSPESFQGLGEVAYAIARKVCTETRLPLMAEITDPRQVDRLMDVVDCFQVGSRNMHNYELLKELGKIKKPILLKRGFAALVKEWILAAEYILKGGNEQVVLCERGIRTFETSTRNTLDLNSVAYIKSVSQLPVIVDPSHGTGLSSLVKPLSLAAAAVGADGIMIEVHPRPTEALSDGAQALTYEQFEELVDQLNPLLKALGREFTAV